MAAFFLTAILFLANRTCPLLYFVVLVLYRLPLTMRMIRFTVLSLVLFLATFGSIQAQDPESDPTLPEITPREIEIRGEYRVVFPSLERPTLQELQPRTRVQALPLEGLPAASSIGFRVDALPALDLSPPEARYNDRSLLAPLLDGMNGSLEVAGGRFTERRAAADIQLPLSSRLLVRMHGDYKGMNGAQPFDQRDARTAFDTGAGTLDLSYRGEAWGLESSLNGAYQQYDLYGVQAPIPERTVARLTTEHTLRVHQGVPLTWSVGYEGHDLETGALSFTTQRAYTDMKATLGLSAVDFRVEGAAELAGHFGDAAFSGDSRSGVLHGILRVVDHPTLQVEGGVSVMSATTNQARPGTESTQTYGAPYALVEWRPTTQWMLYAEQRPSLTLHTPINLAQDNPYLSGLPDLGSTANTLNATAGVQWSPGAAQIDVHARLVHSPTRRFFESSRVGTFAIQYLEATTWTLGTDATLQALAPWFGTVSFSYTGGSVDEGDGLPLVARATGEATLGYQFSDRRARLQLHLRGQSARDLSSAATTTVPGFVSIGVSGDVQVTPNIELTAYVQDIGSNDVTEWPGYPQPTARVGGGLRLLW